MKKILPIFLVALIIPQLVFASWWNPFSWFDNWSFSKQQTGEEKTAELERKVQELEQKLNSTSTSTQSESQTVPIEVKKTESKSTNVTQPVIPVVTPQAIVPTASQSKPVANFDVRCSVSKSEDIKMGDIIKARLSDLNDGISSYNIEWNRSNLNKVTSFNEATFSFDSGGQGRISATVTRKSNGAEKVIECLNVNISSDKSEVDSQNSPECISAKKAVSAIESEIKPLQDKLDAYYDDYLKTGNYNNSSEKTNITSKLADLALRQSGLLNKKYAICDNFYPTPPKIYNTNCYSSYGTINCTTQ